MLNGAMTERFGRTLSWPDRELSQQLSGETGKSLRTSS
jgi:hypothetical protein